MGAGVAKRCPAAWGLYRGAAMEVAVEFADAAEVLAGLGPYVCVASATGIAICVASAAGEKPAASAVCAAPRAIA